MRSRLETARHVVAPAALAFAAGRTILWAAARRDRFDSWSADAWVRFDSEHYLAIARHGYVLARCASDSAYGDQAWCGNTGWLPAYPAAVWVLGKMGVSGPLAGVLVAGLCHLLTLMVIAGLSRSTPWPARLAMLLVVATAPGQVYHHAVFPVSLFAVLAVGAMALCHRGRWVTGGLLGAFAAASYSTGFLLAPVLLLGGRLGSTNEGDGGRAARGGAVAAGMTVGGFLVAMAVQWAFVGDWWGFFKVQAKYGHGLHSPIGPLAAAGTALRENPRDWIALQTIVVATLMLLLLLALAARRLRPEGLERFLVVFAATYWLVPLVVGGRLSLYRAESVLLPAFMLTRRAPVAVQLLLAASFAYLDYRMGIRFFRGILV